MTKYWFLKECFRRNIITFTYEDEDGWERKHDFPARRVICSRCNGNGVHDHPAFSNGITAEEWERDWDEESREDYRRGRFDVPCEECGGNKIVLEIDRQLSNAKMLAELDLWIKDYHETRATEAAERRMGA